MREGERIADQLERSLRGTAWHGPSLMEILGDVTADEAQQRPVREAHSMAELVAHITAWIEAATRGLDGTAVELTPAEDWPAVAQNYDWSQAVEALRHAATRLADRARALDDAALDQRVHGSGRRYPAYGLLHGVVQHNLYHAGQLALLKKAIRAR